MFCFNNNHQYHTESSNIFRKMFCNTSIYPVSDNPFHSEINLRIPDTESEDASMLIVPVCISQHSRFIVQVTIGHQQHIPLSSFSWWQKEVSMERAKNLCVAHVSPSILKLGKRILVKF